MNCNLKKVGGGWSDRIEITFEAGVYWVGRHNKSQSKTIRKYSLYMRQIDVLVNKLLKKINDKRVLKLIKNYLESGNGLKTPNKERKRVFESVKKLIENKVRLKVNENKSVVDLVTRRKFLGFSFYFTKGLSKLKEIEGWIRRRSRTCIWKQWKKIRTRHTKLNEARSGKLESITKRCQLIH